MYVSQINVLSRPRKQKRLHLDAYSDAKTAFVAPNSGTMALVIFGFIEFSIFSLQVYG